ncbi:MAG: hypothetical protein KKG47_07950 [Proteobacteria bacterium]|nr:hypothetical protein [Pseudomonadota bacterium]MBU1738231.1 hypothetical protein [Pseudomonadota bacterium]
MRYKAVVFAILVLFFLAGQGSGWCRTNDMKQLCANCHTMHNSAGGLEVTPGGIGVQNYLLNSTCYGCHSGTNTAGSMPYVTNVAGEPNYGTTGTSAAGVVNGTLAGGSFYWVSQGDNGKGHNVEGLEIVAQGPRTPPGGSKVFDNTSPSTALTCAGTNGCHGNLAVAGQIPAMYRTHHANPALPVDGASVASSYRFLNGIVGLEDLDYEFTVSSAADNHNQYRGSARSADNDLDTSSISHLCAVCHGFFHNGGGNNGVGDPGFVSPWIRHPVDYDMNDAVGAEYQDYGGAGNQYLVETPVASDDLTGGAKSTVLKSPGDAIITCITCHRAHGSRFDSSLRWDYKSWPASGYNGCGDCHTFKD